MTAEYKRDLYNSYLIFEEGMLTTEGFELKMLINNKIPGFLKMEIKVVDNKNQYYYDITSSQSLLQLFEKRKINKNQIILLIEEIFTVLETAKEFFLNENSLVLYPEFLYAKLPSLELEVCYLPGYNHSIKEQLIGIFEFMMDKVNYEEKDAVKLSYELYQCNRDKNATINELKALLRQEKDMVPETVYQKQDRVNETADDNETADSVTVYKDKECAKQEKTKIYYPKKTWIYCILSTAGLVIACFLTAQSGVLKNPLDGRNDIMRIMLFLMAAGIIEYFILNYLLDEKRKVSTVWKESPSEKRKTDKAEPKDNYEEGTVILARKTEQNSICEYGLFSENKEVYQDIPLVEFPFFIGKLKKNVDYVIPSQTISRFHAKIERDQDTFYIEDLNSTNGTFVNGERIPVNGKKEINVRDKIAFAEVMYNFNKF